MLFQSWYKERHDFIVYLVHGAVHVIELCARAPCLGQMGLLLWELFGSPSNIATHSYFPLVSLPPRRASEEAFLAESDGDSPGSEWERVARLCDFNPKTNKQAKDVSRMRSVLISLKQTPLVR